MAVSPTFLPSLPKEVPVEVDGEIKEGNRIYGRRTI